MALPQLRELLFFRGRREGPGAPGAPLELPIRRFAGLQAERPNRRS